MMETSFFDSKTLYGTKVVLASAMAKTEKESIENGASSEQYMEKAAEGIAKRIETITQKQKLSKQLIVLAGKGNNGGDAYAVARILQKKGYAVSCFCLTPKSTLAKKKCEEFQKEGGKVAPLNSLHLPKQGILLDGLFGTGFHGNLPSEILEIWQQIAQTTLYKIAIDIPSGISGDTGEFNAGIPVFDETICLGFPKIGLYLKGARKYIGTVTVVSFGLADLYKHQIPPAAYLLKEDHLATFFPKLAKTQHKYEAGYVLALAGSKGMSGAAYLATLSALRTGSGIVRLYYPKEMEGEIQEIAPEIVKVSWDPKKQEYQPFLQEMQRASALLIGPGLRHIEGAEQFVLHILQKAHIPLVIDADGLFLCQEIWKKCSTPIVITPHIGEMKRLLGKKQQTEEIDFFSECQSYVKQHHVILVLKGAPSFVFTPISTPIVIDHGDPGMATAGAGDVLTGMIASLLSQKIPPAIAACLAVYLHARAGESAAQMKTSRGIIASDLIDEIPMVLKPLTK